MRKIILLLCAAMTLTSAITVDAKEPDSLTLKETYQSFTVDEKYPFASDLVKNNTSYELIEATYEVISEKKLTVSTNMAIDIKSDPYEKDAAYTADQTINQDDTILHLQSTDKEDITISTTYKYPYTEMVSYDYNIEDADIPTSIKEKDSGQPIKLKEITPGNSEWIDNPINITYTNYNAEFFMLGDTLIERSDTDEPPLLGYEELILNYLGLDKKLYDISSISWVSDPYLSSGTICRDAVAAAQMLVTKKTAVYEGTIKKQRDKVMSVYTNHYTGTKELDTGSIQYTITGTATYHKKETGLSLAYPLAGGGFLICFFLVFYQTKQVKVYSQSTGGYYEYIGRTRATKKKLAYHITINRYLQNKAESNHYILKFPKKFASSKQGSVINIFMAPNKTHKLHYVLKNDEICFIWK